MTTRMSRATELMMLHNDAGLSIANYCQSLSFADTQQLLISLYTTSCAACDAVFPHVGSSAATLCTLHARDISTTNTNTNANKIHSPHTNLIESQTTLTTINQQCCKCGYLSCEVLYNCML